MIKQEVLPSDIKIERDILGYLIVSEDSRHFNIVDHLKADCFYDSNHVLIFNEYNKQKEEGGSIDITTMHSALSKSNVNMNEFSSLLNTSITNEDSFNTYAAILIELRMKRSFITVGTKMVNGAYRSDVDVFDSMQTMANAIEGIDNIDKEGVHQGVDIFSKALLDTKERMDNPDKAMGIPSGFRFLDQATNGWNKDGELVTIGARTGMGKTTMALNLCSTAILKGYQTLFASCEMDAKQLADKMLANLSGYNTQDITNGATSPEEYDNLVSNILPQLSKGITMMDKAGLSLESIKSTARKMKAKGGLDIIFVDYIQILKVADLEVNKKPTPDIISHITMNLKNLSAELKVPVIALAQLNRAAANKDDKTPMMHELKGSGSIEQDSNRIILLHRPSYYDAAHDDKTDMMLVKNRSGANTKLSLDFNGATSSFRQHDIKSDSRQIVSPNKDVAITNQTMFSN